MVSAYLVNFCVVCLNLQVLFVLVFKENECCRKQHCKVCRVVQEEDIRLHGPEEKHDTGGRIEIEELQ